MFVVGPLRETKAAFLLNAQQTVADTELSPSSQGNRLLGRKRGFIGMKKSMAKGKQTYSIYKDEQLIASNCALLTRATKFVRKDALDERSADRFPVYTIMGTLGLKWSVVYEKGKMRCEEIA